MPFMPIGISCCNALHTTERHFHQPRAILFSESEELLMEEVMQNQGTSIGLINRPESRSHTVSHPLIDERTVLNRLYTLEDPPEIKSLCERQIEEWTKSLNESNDIEEVQTLADKILCLATINHKIM
jgi:hypothetical protein